MEERDDGWNLNDGEVTYNIRHRAFYFSKQIIAFVKNAKYERVFFSLFDQLVRSATSIGANLVEGRSGSSRRDWRNFCLIALKSANETKYWLCLLRDTMPVDEKIVQALIQEANEISKIIASILINAEKGRQV